MEESLSFMIVYEPYVLMNLSIAQSWFFLEVHANIISWNSWEYTVWCGRGRFNSHLWGGWTSRLFSVGSRSGWKSFPFFVHLRQLNRVCFSLEIWKVYKLMLMYILSLSNPSCISRVEKYACSNCLMEVKWILWHCVCYFA